MHRGPDNVKSADQISTGPRENTVEYISQFIDQGITVNVRHIQCDIDINKLYIYPVLEEIFNSSLKFVPMDKLRNHLKVSYQN